MITPSFSLTATERVLPNMALDFTTASLDSRVTFTRTGNTATVTNSSGFVVPINADLPRFDFDPVALTCKGLLIEESRTNVLLYSEDLSNVVWTKSLLNTTGTPPYIDVGVSPSNVQNADLVIPDTSSSVAHNISTVTPVITAGATISVSIFVKAGGYNFVLLRASNAPESAAFQTTINLTNGTVSTASAYGTGASAVNATITAYPNSWYRVTLTGAITLLTVYKITAYIYSTIGLSAFAGNGTSGVYLWGAQAELATFATSYIPTVASQVTRTADVASMTGTNFSSWYNASEGAFLVVADRIFTGNFTSFIYPFAANDNTNSNEIAVLSSSGTTQIQIGMSVGGVSQLTFSFGLFNVEPSKMIAAYKQNNTQFGMNGLSKTTDTSCNIPTVTQLAIGRRTTGGYWAGHIQKLSYYPQRLISEELAAFSK